jgi:predicted HNH restriction endonuclease
MGIIVIEKIDSVLPKYKITKTGPIQISYCRTSISQEKGPISLEIEESFLEGGIAEITLELKHRDLQLRKKAIEANGGYFCSICGFDFEKYYGELGKNFIEVHHKIPISDGERQNTTNDVVVVCANCHRILHRNGKMPVPVEQLKKEIRELQKLRKKE